MTIDDFDRPLSDAAEIDALWRWANFRPDEFRCKGSGQLFIVPAFMDKLQTLREVAGFPFHINSGYRSPKHNKKVSPATGLTGPHTTGRAVDIAAYGGQARTLLNFALQSGFTGIGVKQNGPRKGRFIHLDDLHEPDHAPRPWLWSY